MKSITSGSISHAVAGAVGALITLSLFACLSASRERDDSANFSSIGIKDAKGHVRVSLGEDSDRPGNYGLSLYSKDGKDTLLKLCSTDAGAEATFYDQNGKVSIWIWDTRDGAELTLFHDGLGLATLRAGQDGKGHFSLSKTKPTTIDGQSATTFETIVDLPEK